MSELLRRVFMPWYDPGAAARSRRQTDQLVARSKEARRRSEVLLEEGYRAYGRAVRR